MNTHTEKEPKQKKYESNCSARKKSHKTIYLLVCVVVLFMCSWIPLNLLNVLLDLGFYSVLFRCALFIKLIIPLKERVHSEMKISLLKKGIFLFCQLGSFPFICHDILDGGVTGK